MPRLPSPSPAAGCSGFPGERGTTAAAQREHPETEGRRGPPPGSRRHRGGAERGPALAAALADGAGRSLAAPRGPGPGARGQGWGRPCIATSARLCALLSRGERVLQPRFRFGPPSARGERGGGADGGPWSGGGEGARTARVCRARTPRAGQAAPGPGVGSGRRRGALAALGRGEQQRILMLTDEYGRLPPFPSSHFRPITVPVFVV